MEYYPVEIQFRTLSMDFWSSMEHRICYKKEYDDKDEMSKLMQQYARDLEEMERICREKVMVVGGKVVQV